jgi:hypothetical protein
MTQRSFESVRVPISYSSSPRAERVAQKASFNSERSRPMTNRPLGIVRLPPFPFCRISLFIITTANLLALGVIARADPAKVARQYRAVSVGEDGKDSEGEVATIKRTLRESDPSSKIKAIRALADRGKGAVIAIDELISLFDDSSSDVAEAATLAVPVIGKAAVPSLLKCADAKSASSRSAAITALGLMRVDAGKPGEKAVLRALDDPSDRVKVAAICAASFREPRLSSAIPALTALAKNAQGLVRGSAIASLGMFGTDASAAADSMLDIIADKTADRYHRVAAARALSRIGVPIQKAPPLLDKCLRDPMEPTALRTAVAYVLATSPEACAFSTTSFLAILGDMQKGKEDFDAAFAMNCLEALARSQLPPKSLSLLEAAAREKRQLPEGIAAAVTSIGNLGNAGQPASPFLWSLINDRDSDYRVRGAAVRAYLSVSQRKRAEAELRTLVSTLSAFPNDAIAQSMRVQIESLLDGMPKR